MNTADLLLENGRPDDVVLVDGARRHTYDDLRRAVRAVAGELTQRRLPPGARVGILGPNSLFWVAGYLAAMRLGLVAVPLSDRSTPDDVRRNADLVGCAAVLVDRRCVRRFGPAVAGRPQLTDDVLDGAPATGSPEPPACRATDPDADAVLMFTSGSTSRPKAVRITHRNIAANTASITEALGIGRDDAVLVVLPLFYCFGASLLHTHLRAGARLVLCNSFVYPETAIDLLEREQCTEFAGVPSSYRLLLRAGTFGSRRLPALRLLQSAGGRLPAELADELRAAQPGADLVVMYGQTEATARLSYLPPAELDRRRGSIGRGVPGVELRVLDDTGRPVPPGVTGEIYARGDNVSPGYADDPAASADKFTVHGLRTGDLAVVDEDGYVYVTGRRDDFVKSWGYRVSCHEVEACALALPDVAEAVAVGVPDDEAGEAVVLVVTARAGAPLEADAVLAACRARLAKYLVPRAVHVLPALPLNGNGKPDKGRLRALVAPVSVGAGPGERR